MSSFGRHTLGELEETEGRGLSFGNTKKNGLAELPARLRT